MHLFIYSLICQIDSFIGAGHEDNDFQKTKEYRNWLIEYNNEKKKMYRKIKRVQESNQNDKEFNTAFLQSI